MGVPDGNTIVLDNFDSSTKGQAFGAITYVDGLSRLGKAANLSKGTYVKYSFAPWYRWDGAHVWNRQEAAAGVVTEGTIEMWIKPRQYPLSMLNFNWGDTGTYPSAGHIMHMGLNPEGKLIYGVWGGNGDKSPVGKTTIPVGKWTHVAVTWSSNGTRLYVDGVEDAYTSGNVWPAFSGTVFAYLNYWGGADFGLVDEFHVSKVARTAEEIRSRVKIAAPIGGLPVAVIEGVGKDYAKKLEARGINTVGDMAIADVFALAKAAGIPLVTLYAWKRKAALATDVRVDGALFGSVAAMRLGDIIVMPDSELASRTSQPMAVVSDLKAGISALLVALDNEVAMAMKLDELA